MNDLSTQKYMIDRIFSYHFLLLADRARTRSDFRRLSKLPYFGWIFHFFARSLLFYQPCFNSLFQNCIKLICSKFCLCLCSACLLAWKRMSTMYNSGRNTKTSIDMSSTLIDSHTHKLRAKKNRPFCGKSHSNFLTLTSNENSFFNFGKLGKKIDVASFLPAIKMFEHW